MAQYCHTISIFYCLRFTSWESSLECATEIRSQTRRQNGRSRCKYDFRKNVSVRYSSSCSSSGKDHAENLHSIKNQPKQTLKQRFNVTEKLIRDQKEVWGIPVVKWQQRMWQRTTLLTDKAVQFAIAKTYVFSHSALCMGGISSNPVKAWKEKIDWFVKSHQDKELDRIDGEPMKFECNNSPGFTTLQILCWDSEYDDWNTV